MSLSIANYFLTSNNSETRAVICNQQEALVPVSQRLQLPLADMGLYKMECFGCCSLINVHRLSSYASHYVCKF